jgi:hypothetical protein
MLKLILIKTPKGNYLTKENSSSNYQIQWYEGLLFNSNKPVVSFKKNWIFLDEDLSEIGNYVSQPNINYRYELIDKSMVSEKLKLVFKREDIAYNGDDGYWHFKEEYKPYRSLYEDKSDKQPDIYEKVEFEIVKALEFDDLINVNGFSYPIEKKIGSIYKNVDLTKEHVTYELLTELCVPDIARESFPAALTSEQTYAIIRKHVQDNIDPKYAKITSDYSFCFTVKKKIEKTTPEKYVYDENFVHNLLNKRKRKPKHKTAYRELREVEVFEMTHSEEKYKNYTVIQGFKANSLPELKNVIDTYLEKLMAMINEPLKDCPHCNGKGVMLDA